MKTLGLDPSAYAWRSFFPRSGLWRTLLHGWSVPCGSETGTYTRVRKKSGSESLILNFLEELRQGC